MPNSKNLLEQELVSMLEKLNIKQARYTLLTNLQCYVSVYTHKNVRYWRKLNLSLESINELKLDIENII